MFMMTRI